MMSSERPGKKPNVVLDTNIIVSAALSHDSPPAEIFELLLSDKIQNFSTKEILDEIKEVLNRDKIVQRAPIEVREFIISTFEQKSTFVLPKSFPKIVPEDPKDDKFFHCATTANVDFIVSGDQHVLKIKKYQKIRVLSPRDFIEETKKDDREA